MTQCLLQRHLIKANSTYSLEQTSIKCSEREQMNQENWKSMEILNTSWLHGVSPVIFQKEQGTSDLSATALIRLKGKSFRKGKYGLRLPTAIVESVVKLTVSAWFSFPNEYSFQLNIFCFFSFSFGVFFFFHPNRYVSSRGSCCILLQVLIRAGSLINWKENDITCHLFPWYRIVKYEVSVHQLASKHYNCMLRNSRYILPYAAFVPSLPFKTPLGALQHYKYSWNGCIA